MAQNTPVKKVSQNGHNTHGKHDGQPEVETQKVRVCETKAHEGANHHEVALSEIHRLSRLVNKHKTQRDESVNAPIRQATYHELDEIQPISSQSMPRLFLHVQTKRLHHFKTITRRLTSASVKVIFYIFYNGFDAFLDSNF
jgi:hypothetical protein